MGRLITSTYPLTESASVVLNASGRGTVYIGPKNVNTTWTIRSVSVAVSTNVLEAIATVYMNSVGRANRRSGSFSGSSGDTDDDFQTILRSGTRLAVEWVGGDASATATVTVYGDVTTGRP